MAVNDPSRPAAAITGSRAMTVIPALAQYIGKLRWRFAREGNDLCGNAVSHPAVAIYGGHRRA
jgi:hypothetical protein